MPPREPAWWYGPDDNAARRALLGGLSRVWGRLAARRFAHARPVRAPIPVICIGNFTAGGAGKTPVAQLVARHLLRLGERPVFLSRGYGGCRAGPHRVDGAQDTAADVGDEPLLLARDAPVIVARDRRAGIAEVARSGASVAVMDDGMQNPAIAKDLVIAVVDGVRGLGNRRVMPAGPLRAPLAFQFTLAGAILVLGDAREDGIAAELRTLFKGPVMTGRIEPAGAPPTFAGGPVVAYAGIANPAKLFASLEGLGCTIVARESFPDHHPFSAADAARLLAMAAEHSAPLVTTEKDLVRLAGATGALGALAAASAALAVEVRLDAREAARLTGLLEAALKTRRAAAEASG